MAAVKGVALVAIVVMAFVAACSAAAGDHLYVHFQDRNNVEVFSAKSSENVLVPGFGDGQVFDYPVTFEESDSSKVVARAQGLFYQASNQKGLNTFQEEFTVLFVDENSGAYLGTSFSFSGVWASGFPHEFPILGGSGWLIGFEGTVLLTWVSGDTYKLTVKELTAPRFRSFLANRAYNKLA